MCSFAAREFPIQPNCLGFEGLVKLVYAGLGEIQTAPEVAAYKRQQYDTVLGLLEARIVDGRRTVRREELTERRHPH